MEIAAAFQQNVGSRGIYTVDRQRC